MKRLSGIDAVYGVDLLRRTSRACGAPPPAGDLHTDDPAEGMRRAATWRCARSAIAPAIRSRPPSREGMLRASLRARFPQFEVQATCRRHSTRCG